MLFVQALDSKTHTVTKIFLFRTVTGHHESVHLLSACAPCWQEKHLIVWFHHFGSFPTSLQSGLSSSHRDSAATDRNLRSPPAEDTKMWNSDSAFFYRLLDKPLRTLARAVWTPCTSEIPCPRCQRGSAVGLGVSVNVGPSVRTGDGMGADSWSNSKRIGAQVGGRFDTAGPTDSFSDSTMQPTGDGQPCRPTK